jgi:toxin ParE1/3/4
LPDAVAKYKISVRARGHLYDIYKYTASTFGEYQAEAYLSGLERTFGLLADFPGIGQLAEELAKRHKRFRFQAHVIFYTQEADSILIRAVFHHARKIRPQLFD